MQLIGHLADEFTRRGHGMFQQKILPPMDGWLSRLIGSCRADGIVVIQLRYEGCAHALSKGPRGIGRPRNIHVHFRPLVP